MNKRLNIQKLVFAGICLALSILLPLVTAHIPQIGNMLSPMHIPVLLCGFLSGGPLGAVVGFVAPLLSSVLMGRPPMFPIAITMSFELMAYGLAAGLLHSLLPKKKVSIYISLILAMLIGRAVWGIAASFTFPAAGWDFSFPIFMNMAFVSAIPGIILHIILIPILVMALQRAFPSKELL